MVATGEVGTRLSAAALLRRVLGGLLSYRRLFLTTVTSIVAFTITSLLTPYVLGEIIDKCILRGDVGALALMTSAYLGLLLGQWVSQTVRGYSIQSISQLFLRDLRNRVFSKLQRLPYRFYVKRRVGELISITINDTSVLNDVLISGTLSVIGDLIAVAGVIIIMLLLDARLAIVSLANIPVLIAIARVFGGKLKSAHRSARRRIAEVTTLVEEGIAGITAIKAFNREGEAVSSFSNSSRKAVKAYIEIAKLMGVFWPSMDFTVTLSTVAVLVYGSYLVLTGAVSIGLIVAFIQYVNRLARPITQFVNMYDSLQAALAAAERIYSIIDSEEELEDSDAVELSNVKGEVIVRNVTFSYVPGRPVLKDVSLRVRPGETVALVGHTGAGKSTLASLIMRLYDPDEGSVLIDGVDIRKVRLGSLRRIIGYVPQETYLFPGTIIDNIRIGKPGASDAEVINVCRRLHIHEFMERLPQGYYTEVGEAGRKLSTGEKQLISIARVMLRDPSIVIMDEALSSIDAATEEIIREAMKELMKGRTSIIIAHRLSTARECDRIVVLEKGRVVEEGTHEELMARKGRYYKLYTAMAGASPQRAKVIEREVTA